MLTFRDVQKVVIDRALQQARSQIPRQNQLESELKRRGAPTQVTSSLASSDVLRVDDQGLDTPGVVLSD